MHPATGRRTLQGRIGFERRIGTAPLWDEKAQDFVPAAIKEGTVSPFAIGAGLRVAFQLRPGTIKRTTFTGALRDLLAEGSGVNGWAVTPFQGEPNYARWREVEVVRIEKITLTLERPNPHYGKRQAISDVVENTHASIVTMAITGRDGVVNETSDFVSQGIEHAAAGYGHFVATGQRKDGTTSTYRSDRDGAPPERRVEVDKETREVSAAALTQLAHAEIAEIDLTTSEPLLESRPETE